MGRPRLNAAFAANTDGPSSQNRGPNNFNGGASSTWGTREEIVVRISVLRARDDEFYLGFHELSLCVSEWSSLNSTVSMKLSSLNSTLVLFEFNLATCIRQLKHEERTKLSAVDAADVNAESKFQPLQNASNPQELKVKRSDFPIDFVFGVTAAAAQMEGSAKEAGRGPSVWDYYIEKFPGRIADHTNMFTAIDSYKRYKEEVKNLKDLGVDSHRFSISWTRILPTGTLSGGVNQEGIDHYNNFINELIKNDITPFVTILHFDPPQALTDKYGGILNRSFVKDFKDYSELCFKLFGDRVKNWFTINEPWIMAKMGYDKGVGPPGRCSVQTVFPCTNGGNSATEPYIVAHHLLLAHASVVEPYRKKFQAKCSH
ncbi:putative beta-glucosidase 9 [Malus domestica]|uniref:putative beta-glucosidase 9 n=1 Tax=Malus domestica TaxID=3750 RepID=UPI003974CEEB